MIRFIKKDKHEESYARIYLSGKSKVLTNRIIIPSSVYRLKRSLQESWCMIKEAFTTFGVGLVMVLSLPINVIGEIWGRTKLLVIFSKDSELDLKEIKRHVEQGEARARSILLGANSNREDE